jgi:AcrR family transcriptional regulator
VARPVHEAEREARINEMLDAAQRLIYTKGYDHMTVQDLLDALDMSKGAFYYYFDSKQALLEAMVTRMVSQMTDAIAPVVADETMPALDRLEAIFRMAVGWKSRRLDLLVGLVRVWYDEDNALMREKLTRIAHERFGAILKAVIAQGIAEGCIHTDYPDLAGGIAVDLLQCLSAEIARCLISWDRLEDGPRRLERLIDAYTATIERLLGVAPGSIHLVDPAVLHAWGERFAAAAVLAHKEGIG